MPEQPGARKVGIRAALKTIRTLDKLYGKMGSNVHPRGVVMSAYRKAREGLKIGLNLENTYQRNSFIANNLETLKNDLRVGTRPLLVAAYAAGATQATTELTARGFEPPLIPVSISEELKTWQAKWDSQLDWVNLQIRNGVDPAEIVGDQSRVGSLSAAGVLTLGALLLTAAALAGWQAKVKQTRVTGNKDPEDYWWKQAIAVIDNRTTNCCLGVHGQVRPLRYSFTTTGQPHFALHQKWAPFHYYCRTCVVMLYEDEAKDEHTQRLTAEAAAQLKKNKK